MLGVTGGCGGGEVRWTFIAVEILEWEGRESGCSMEPSITHCEQRDGHLGDLRERPISNPYYSQCYGFVNRLDLASGVEQALDDIRELTDACVNIQPHSTMTAQERRSPRPDEKNVIES